MNFIRVLCLAALLVGQVACGAGSEPEINVLPLVWEPDGDSLYHHTINEGTLYLYQQSYHHATMVFVPKSK